MGAMATTVGNWSPARLLFLTRITAELDGKGAKRPGLARMICSCKYRFDEVQALRAAVFRKPSDRGFLTRSDRGPRRAEHWLAPDRMGDFSPCLPRSPIPRRLGFVPTEGNLPRTVAKGAIQGDQQTLPARPPPKAASVAVRAPSPCSQVQAVCGRSGGVGISLVEII